MGEQICFVWAKMIIAVMEKGKIMRFEGMEEYEEIKVENQPYSLCKKQGKATYKYTIGVIGGILLAILANFTAPITIINFITAVFMGIFKLFITMIGCFLAYIVFMLLGRCIPIITSKMWEQVCWAWQEVKDFEEDDAEI